MIDNRRWFVIIDGRTIMPDLPLSRDLAVSTFVQLSANRDAHVEIRQCTPDAIAAADALRARDRAHAAKSSD